MFGAGYVGLVTGACFAELGHEVVIRDVIPERIERLQAGEVPIYEPGLDLVLERNAERIRFTLDVHEAVDGADFLYVAVGTPPTESGDADLARRLERRRRAPAEHPGRPIVVMKSTVPVGTGEHVRARLDARGLTGVGYVSNPEFLAEGSAVADFMKPDRLVVGAFEEARRRPRRRAAPRHRDRGRAHRRPVGRAREARRERVPLDAHQLHQRDRERLRARRRRRRRRRAAASASTTGSGRTSCAPGIGFGGSCFPKDVTALKQLAGNSGYQFLLLHAVWEVNELQKRRVVSKLQKHLGSLRGKTIALLGLAFKPNTDDMREAPSRVIAYRLLSEGAEVRAWDPIAQPDDLHGIELLRLGRSRRCATPTPR